MCERILGTVTYFYDDGNGGDVEEFEIGKLFPGTTLDSIKKKNGGRNCCFEYEDEDGDIVKGNTEQEWKAVLSTAGKLNKFGVNVYFGRKEDGNQDNCGTKSNSLSSGSSPCTVVSSYQKPSTSCCMLETNVIIPDGKPIIKRENPDLSSYKYKKEALYAVNLPLGPIGGGSISIAGDGGLRQWQISNQINHLGHVPNSFFGLRVNKDCFVLQSDAYYTPPEGFKKPPIGTDFHVPKGSVTLLSKTCGVESVEVTAKYPVVEVDYMDPKFSDFSVHLEAWSPKIPLNAVDSGLPVIYFDFTVTNNSKSSAEVSVLASLQNMIGWDGKHEINEETFPGYGSNKNEELSNDSYYGIKMYQEKSPEKQKYDKMDPLDGNVSIVAIPKRCHNKSMLLQYDKIEILWDNFKSNPVLPGPGKSGCSPDQSTFHGALNLTTTLSAGETETFTYAIAWHFPNRYKDWVVDAPLPNTKVFVGNFYSQHWKSIEEVVEAAVMKYSTTRALTFKFRDDMFGSLNSPTTIPWQLVDSIAGRTSVLNSPSCMWLGDKNFYAYEGCNTTAGCCPMNCTHVWNYEMSLAYLFPSLERNMRQTDLLCQISPHGVIPSRTNVPLELRRIWNAWEDYTTDPASPCICVDGEIGTVLKVYREIRNGAGMDWLRKMWKPVKLVMNRWLNELDMHKNGMIYGAQPNTYDVATYGYSIFVGLLYLCGLLAAAEMAKMIGESEKEFCDICVSRFLLGSNLLDKTCYNGQWYIQIPDPNHQVNLMTDATFVGVMYGQWWANILELGYLLPKEHISSHLMSVYHRNKVLKFDPSTQKPRQFADELDKGWVTGKWDDGKKPQSALLYSSEIAWTGVIYPFASMLLQEGHIEEGLEVLQWTREFYDGTRRSPWNDIECGDHYTRAMSSFSLNLTASGQKWRADSDGNLALTFNPLKFTSTGNEYRGFMTIPHCWGTYQQQFDADKGSAQLKLSYGNVALSSFGVSKNQANNVIHSVTAGGKAIEFTTVKDNNYVVAQFKSPIKLEVLVGSSEVMLVVNYTK